MNPLRISPGFALPLDTVTQAIAILARKGAGKTYTGSVLVEEIVKAKVPVVVLDPTGAWWGLRTSADGERPGLPVVIFGGDHGDVPLDRGTGRIIADVVLEHPGAYVLDLSAFEAKAHEISFAADFLERLYRAKKRETGPLLLVVDEADVFAPQRPMDRGDQIRSLGALEAIVRRGRIKGLGDVLITQRAAVLNKNCLTQTEILVVMQTTGPQDRAAIDDWIKGNGSADERAAVLDSLASLRVGEAWVWSPSFLRVLQRVQIRQRTTFDSSRTPAVGETTIVAKTFATVDLERLGDRIQKAHEKAKADDPKELRRRIIELERSNQNLQQMAMVRPEPQTIETIIEKAVFTKDDRQTVDRVLKRFDEAVAEVGDLARTLGSLIPVGVAQTAERRVANAKATGSIPVPDSKPIARPMRLMVGYRSTAHPNNGGEQLSDTLYEGDPATKLSRTEAGVLNVLAQFETRTQAQVALLSGYSPTSGGFFKALADLRKKAYIEGTASELRITAVGREAVLDVEPLPSDLLGYWTNRLGKTEAAVLKALAEVHPDSLPQVDVAAVSGYSPTSGGFFGALSKLRKLDLISGSASGLRITDDLVGGT